MNEAMTLYAPPAAELVVADGEAETLRKEYIRHEANVRGVGALYYMTAAMLGFAALVTLVTGFDPNLDHHQGFALGLFALYAVVGAGFAAVGRGLRRLRGWVKIPVGILSGIGVLGFPIGTLINGYILYLMFSRKGTMVFSQPYREVVAQTPHIKHRTSIVVWAALAVIVVLIGAGLVIPMFY
ncbi:MAG: hypothetical protein ACR2RL_25300 [Gammaproteobacteria bacterium]